MLFPPNFEEILRARQPLKQMQVIRESHCVRVRCWCQKTLCASSGSCPHIDAIVCKCAWLCSVIACHHFTRRVAISARAGNTLHFCKSWALVKLCPWLSFAAISYALPLDRARRYRHTYASRPVIDALPIRDIKIKRLWLHGDLANKKPVRAAQFAAIACNLHPISALLLPLKAYRPPKCLALPSIFPKGTREVSRLCSLYPRTLGTISSFRRFCLSLSSASAASSVSALSMMMSLADSAVWSRTSSLMKRSSAKPLHDPSISLPFIPAKGAVSIMEDGVW